MYRVYKIHVALAPRIELWHDRMFSIDDMENTHARNQYRKSSCSCPEVIKYVCFFIDIKLDLFSGSMEPSYYRGDILFLVKREQIVPGDIIVYQIESE